MKSGRCPQQGVYPRELEKWPSSAVGSLGSARRDASQSAADATGPPGLRSLSATFGARTKQLAETAALLVLSNSSRRSTVKARTNDRLEDRQKRAQLVEQAHASGARLEPACQLAGIDATTLQRWKMGDGLVVGDKRPEAVLHAPHTRCQMLNGTPLLVLSRYPRLGSCRYLPMKGLRSQ